MGNCISERSRPEAGRGDRDDTRVSQEGFFQGLWRGLRRRSAEVGITGSSSADTLVPTEGHTTAAVQSVPAVSATETPKVTQPVPFGKNKVGPCKGSPNETHASCQEEELHRLARVSSMFAVERSLEALRGVNNVSADKCERTMNIVEDIDTNSVVEDSRAAAMDKGYNRLYTTVSSLIAMFEDDSNNELATKTEDLVSNDTEDKEEQTHAVEDNEEFHTVATEESHVPLCASVSSLTAMYEEESGDETTDNKNAKSEDAVEPATSNSVQEVGSCENTKADERMASIGHEKKYPNLPGMTSPPRNLEQVGSDQRRLHGDNRTEQESIRRHQNGSETMEYARKESGKERLDGEEVTDNCTGAEGSMLSAENTLQKLRAVIDFPNDCAHAHTSTETDEVDGHTSRIERPSNDNMRKKTDNVDKHTILPIFHIDNKTSEKEADSTTEKQHHVVSNRRKRSCSPVEEEVAFTIIRSLALIKEHMCTGKKDCTVPLYVRPADNGQPKLVTIRASKKQIKDGTAKRQILQSKSVTKMTEKPMINIERKTSKKHIGCQSGLVDDEDSCHRWVQKEGNSVEARIPTVPQFYECRGAEKNARERLGLTKLRKYKVTVQCRAIERIKADENEFPGILPEPLKRRWRKKLNEQKAHMIN